MKDFFDEKVIFNDNSGVPRFVSRITIQGSYTDNIKFIEKRARYVAEALSSEFHPSTQSEKIMIKEVARKAIAICLIKDVIDEEYL